MDTPLVLVIDADPATHDEVAESLAEVDCVLLGARSEALALQLAARRFPAIVLIDTASVADPAELFARLQQIVPHVRAVITTAASSGAVARLVAVGPVLRKPLDPERLRATIRSLSRLSAMANCVADMREEAAATQAVWRRIATTHWRA